MSSDRTSDDDQSEVDDEAVSVRIPNGSVGQIDEADEAVSEVRPGKQAICPSLPTSHLNTPSRTTSAILNALFPSRQFRPRGSCSKNYSCG
jgi:hypothetical protein